jgi:hypothetical protein
MKNYIGSNNLMLEQTPNTHLRPLSYLIDKKYERLLYFYYKRILYVIIVFISVSTAWFLYFSNRYDLIIRLLLFLFPIYAVYKFWVFLIKAMLIITNPNIQDFLLRNNSTSIASREKWFNILREINPELEPIENLHLSKYSRKN